MTNALDKSIFFSFKFETERNTPGGGTEDGDFALEARPPLVDLDDGV